MPFGMFEILFGSEVGWPMAIRVPQAARQSRVLLLQVA